MGLFDYIPESYQKQGKFIPNIQRGNLIKCGKRWLPSHKLYKVLTDRVVNEVESKPNILGHVLTVLSYEAQHLTVNGLSPSFAQGDETYTIYKWISPVTSTSILGFSLNSSHVRYELTGDRVYILQGDSLTYFTLPSELIQILNAIFQHTTSTFKLKHSGPSLGVIEQEWIKENPDTKEMLGADDSGTGSMVGPIFTCTVAATNPLPTILNQVCDSKELDNETLHKLALELLNAKSLTISQGLVTLEELNTLPFKEAHVLAFRRSIESNPYYADHVPIFIDGTALKFPYKTQLCIAQGESQSKLIAAASIIARAAQQSYALELHTKFPYYGFDVHFGHPTPLHLQVLHDIGPTIYHRKTYQPVKRSFAIHGRYLESYGTVEATTV